VILFLLGFSLGFIWELVTISVVFFPFCGIAALVFLGYHGGVLFDAPF